MSKRTSTDNLMKHARRMYHKDRPDCWLFRRDTVVAMLDLYNSNSGKWGKLMRIPESMEGMVFLALPLHIAANDLQYEAVLYYLTEVKGLRVAIRKEEKP